PSMRPSVTANRPSPVAPLVNVGASGGGPASVPCSSSVPAGRGRSFAAGSSASWRPRASSSALSPAPFPSLVSWAVPSTVPARVPGAGGRRHRPARGEVTIAQGAVAEPERGELEGGGGSGGGRGGRRPWRGRRLPERVDVHGARLRAHQVHHRRLDEDAIDDQPAADERQELQPELDLARREEGLPRPQRGLLRDRDARESDARPAADGEAAT